GGLVLGGLIGTLIAFLREWLDRGFRRADQVELATGYRVLGLVPRLTGIGRKQPEQYVVDKPLSMFSEALRTVGTGVRLSAPHQPPRLLMVTS
ncbi:hypothetical protein, partial [Klebsiella pneumoniae]|uniref:hypothetical protein n=1 Tax=Klebsiella pneumoniae TaxID=573 RepID=UPI003012FF1B